MHNLLVKALAAADQIVSAANLYASTGRACEVPDAEVREMFLTTAGDAIDAIFKEMDERNA